MSTTVATGTLSPLVLIRGPSAIASPEGINPSDQAQARIGDIEVSLLGLARVFLAEHFMKVPPSEDIGVGNPQLLDFLQIEEPLAVRQGMKRHDPERRFVQVVLGTGRVRTIRCGVSSVSWNRAATDRPVR